MKKVPAFLLLLLPFLSSAQSERAREHIDTLCSPAMHGRGYVSGGHEKAARYIRSELKAYGVKPLFDGNYFQPFKVDVNTFPGEMELVWNRDTLEPGIGFIPSPVSGSSKGAYEVFHVTPSMLKDDHGMDRIREFGSDGDKMAVLDPEKAKGDSAKRFLTLRYALANKGPVVVMDGKDLTWGVRDTAFSHAILKVDSNRIIPEDGADIRIHVENRFKEGYKTRNAGGRLPGKEPNAKPIVLSAHYDQLGRMGKETYIPGASDNASGTAMLLYLAEHFSKKEPERPLVFLFFGAEELGILGSKHYVQNPAFPLDSIAFLMNIDLVGGGSKGIKVVNGKVHEQELEWLRKMNEEKGWFPMIGARGKAMNSDHYWFSERGVPAFFIYTLGDVDAYHDVHDTADNLPLTKFNELARMLERFVRDFGE